MGSMVYKILCLAIGFALLSVGLSGHVSAMDYNPHHKTMSPEMNMSSPSCQTICISAPIERAIKERDEPNDDDKQPDNSFPKQRQHSRSNIELAIPSNSLGWPLLKVPLHILYEVHRN